MVSAFAPGRQGRLHFRFIVPQSPCRVGPGHDTAHPDPTLISGALRRSLTLFGIDPGLLTIIDPPAGLSRTGLICPSPAGTAALRRVSAEMRAGSLLSPL
jgi:hypothetical protein